MWHWLNNSRHAPLSVGLSVEQRCQGLLSVISTPSLSHDQDMLPVGLKQRCQDKDMPLVSVWPDQKSKRNLFFSQGNCFSWRLLRLGVLIITQTKDWNATKEDWKCCNSNICLLSWLKMGVFTKISFYISPYSEEVLSVRFCCVCVWGLWEAVRAEYFVKI